MAKASARLPMLQGRDPCFFGDNHKMWIISEQYHTLSELYHTTKSNLMFDPKTITGGLISVYTVNGG